MLIVFDGIDGAGKTTHINLISDWLKSLNIDFLKVREPGGSKVSEEIRNIFINNKMDPLSQLMLICAARLENTKVWKSESRLILCDRFIDSTYAYQGCFLSNDIIDSFVNKTALIKPDFVFLFLNSYRSTIKNKMDDFLLKNKDSIISTFKSRVKENYLVVPSLPIIDQQNIIKEKIKSILSL